ncbi:hypothetical protein ACROYT_G014254 [Oculina patagonica]
MLLLSLSHHFISEEEFILLYDASFSKNPTFPHSDYDRFHLDAMDEIECFHEFRVRKMDIPRLADALGLPEVNTRNHVGDKMAASGSDSDIEDELSRKSVEQLRGLLKEKGLSTAGKKKVLIQRLVNAYYESKTAVKSELSESHEDLNFAKLSKELPPSVSKEQSKEITSIRRKAKVLQGDIEALIRDISNLSESEGNKVKIQIRIERLTEFRMAYL